MDRENLEGLDEESLFRIQNTISEIIKERNFKKGDIETIVDTAFGIAFPISSSFLRRVMAKVGTYQEHRI